MGGPKNPSSVYFWGFRLRDFLNAILTFIGAATLSDAEYAAITLTSTTDPFKVYSCLKEILLSRESVSTMVDRLTYYYAAKGYDYGPAVTGKTNILIGGAL